MVYVYVFVYIYIYIYIYTHIYILYMQVVRGKLMVNHLMYLGFRDVSLKIDESDADAPVGSMGLRVNLSWTK